MKILLLNSVCGIKSTGKIVSDLADHLINIGHECKVVYGREYAPTKCQNYAIKIGNKRSVCWHILQTRLFDRTGLCSKKATRELIKIIEDFKPDIIHLHNLHGYYVNVKILFEYLQKKNIRVFWTLHDAWPITGHCACFESIECKEWIEGCHNCPLKNEYPSSVFLDRSQENFKLKKKLFTSLKELTIITPSEWLKSCVNESFLNKYKVVVIPNGINTDVFHIYDHSESLNFRNEYGIGNKKIVLGVASAWSKDKGLYDFFKLSEYLDEDWQIVLVGLNEKQMQLKPDRILGIKRTYNATELAKIYSAADVFFNPTYFDNFPTVNLEARACGTPVVTYESGGSPESAGMNAIVIKKGDIIQAKQAIMTIKKSFEDIECLSNIRSINSYIRLYEEYFHDN